jgi:hypothetical protein
VSAKKEPGLHLGAISTEHFGAISAALVGANAVSISSVSASGLNGGVE